MADGKVPSHITVRKARKLWFRKDGLPREEALYSVDDVHASLKIAFSKHPALESYQRHIAHAVISNLRRKCSKSHVAWTDWPDPNGPIRSGFTNDQDKIAASVAYVEGRRKGYAISTGQQLASLKEELVQIEKK